MLDKIYTWISKVINSCEHSTHIEPCEFLIDFFEKKGANEYQVKALKELLNFKRGIVLQKEKDQEMRYGEEQIEDKIRQLHGAGYLYKSIATTLGIPLWKVQLTLHPRGKQKRNPNPKPNSKSRKKTK